MGFMDKVVEKEKEKAQAVDDVREVLARAEKFYQKWAGFGKKVDEFTNEYRGLKAEIVFLLNEKDALYRQNQEASVRLAAAEREAQTRLQYVEQGHRALVDSLSKKQIDLDNKLSDMEKRDLANAAERHKYEILNDELTRKIAGLTRK